MGSIVAIKSRSEAVKVLNENNDLVNQNNVRQTVQNALCKLNDVEGRIETIENKGFFKRLIGGVTGSNQKEMVAAMRDITAAQNTTIQLVLSLSIMHSQNQKALEDILDELDKSKGTYIRITDHIEFLYSQVENVRESNKKTSSVLTNTKNFLKKTFVGIGIVVGILLIIGLFIYNKNF
ncbi:hypothetical protein AN960_20880 [Bacillus sp. FJAT-25509]|uniref:hypothetical protein n=1 Tax=Bacillus sp. FJAT-25509 TaxID=1712029 RepID=UPI0006F54262|nr:hypothetical protein [Bacillus sp. FJAT-25509]KQL33532.1 hypothetical protein AN960_20880 [Bacillus sp. FJAT-25509]